MKFWTKIKLALAFQTSLNYEAENKYQKVIKTLEKYRHFIDNELSKPFSEYFILLGEAYYKITNYKLAEGYLLNALEHIENETKFNKDEKNYLKYHTYYWLYLTYTNQYDNIKSKQCLNIFERTSFDINNVRKYIQKNFPLDS